MIAFTRSTVERRRVLGAGDRDQDGQSHKEHGEEQVGVHGAGQTSISTILRMTREPTTTRADPDAERYQAGRCVEQRVNVGRVQQRDQDQQTDRKQ